MRINVFQHIRDFTTMRYINLRFTQLPTYSLTRSTRVTSLKFTWLAQPLKNEMVCYSASLWQITAQCATFSCIKTRYFFMKQTGKPIIYAKPYFLVHFHGCEKSFGPASSWLRCDICKLVFTIFRLSASHSGQKSLRKYTSTYIYQQEFTGSWH